MSKQKKSMYEMKKTVVEAGASKIFNGWHKLYGISKEEFLKNLKWVNEDPNPKLSREIAVKASPDAYIRADNMLMRPEDRKMFGEAYDESKCEAHIIHLERVKDDEGQFIGLYTMDTDEYGMQNRFAPQFGVSLSARDRV